MLRQSDRHHSVRTLKELPGNHVSALRNHQGAGDAEKLLRDCQKENQELKIRCGKIDQIEKYVHILVEQNEGFKKNNTELQKKNTQLTREMDRMAREKSFGLQMKDLRQKTLKNEGRLSERRGRSDIEDTFSGIHLQQQIANERQNYEKMVAAVESRWRIELQQAQDKIICLEKNSNLENSQK